MVGRLSPLEDPLVWGKPDFVGEQQHASDFPYESSSSTYSGTSRCWRWLLVPWTIFHLSSSVILGDLGIPLFYLYHFETMCVRISAGWTPRTPQHVFHTIPHPRFLADRIRAFESPHCNPAARLHLHHHEFPGNMRKRPWSDKLALLKIQRKLDLFELDVFRFGQRAFILYAVILIKNTMMIYQALSSLSSSSSSLLVPPPPLQHQHQHQHHLKHEITKPAPFLCVWLLTRPWHHQAFQAVAEMLDFHRPLGFHGKHDAKPLAFGQPLHKPAWSHYFHVQSRVCHLVDVSCDLSNYHRGFVSNKKTVSDREQISCNLLGCAEVLGLGSGHWREAIGHFIWST